MSFIALAQRVVFDATNEEGRILHSDSGECLALDQIATRMVQSGLNHTTKEEVIADLQASIEASDQQLEEGLQAVIQQLRTHNLLDEESQDAMLSSLMQNGQPWDHMTRSSSTTPLFQKQKSTNGQRASWEVFLTGQLLNEPLPSFSLSQRVYALSNVIRILFLLGSYQFIEHILAWLQLQKPLMSVQQREWQSICSTLSAIHARSLHRYTNIDVEILERLARRELIWCQFAVRLFAPIAMCLVRSVAFCAYLRAIGLPAQLVVGRERFCLSDDDDFHAWVELFGRVVNDHDEVQTGYTIMHRLI